MATLNMNPLGGRDGRLSAGLSRTRRAKAAGLPLAVLAVLVLSACGSLKDGTTTGAVDDYRERHPIVVGEAEHTLELPVATGEHTLTTGMKDVIRGFAQDRTARSSGVVRVLYPEGAVNTPAAHALRKQIASELVRAGIGRKYILEGSYPAQGDVAPVRLSYIATTATVASNCGEWPRDIAPTMDNRSYHNFGCASQNNLAAQIANPMDLIAPRAMTQIDADQRSNVIGTYRNGGGD